MKIPKDEYFKLYNNLELKNQDKYIRCNHPEYGWIPVYILVKHYYDPRPNYPPTLPNRFWHCHHKDFDHTNNHPDNLEWIGNIDHITLHGKRNMRIWVDEEYSEFRKQHSERTSKQSISLWEDKDFRDKIIKASSLATSKRNRENWTNEEYRLNMIKFLCETNSTPERKKEISERTINKWVNGEFSHVGKIVSKSNKTRALDITKKLDESKKGMFTKSFRLLKKVIDSNLLLNSDNYYKIHFDKKKLIGYETALKIYLKY